MFDAHLHLRDPRILPYHYRYVREAMAAGVTACIDCATRPEEWASEVACALDVTPAYGLHPWFASLAVPDWLELLTCVLTAEPNALVGEIGLDGIRRVEDGGMDQRRVLQAQLELASRLGRPVVLHGARMWAPLFQFLEPWAKRIPAWMLHGVSFPVEMLNAPFFRAGNVWFGIGGGLLSSGAKHLPALVSALPEDRLLVETDSPDRFPVGGEPLVLGQYHALYNQPANLTNVLHALSRLRAVPFDDLCALTERNARAFIAGGAVH